MADRSSRSTAVVVLAAGLGKRLKSSLPKVLHPVCGRPALWHVLQAARGGRPDRIVVVVHHGADQVAEAVRSWGIKPEPQHLVSLKRDFAASTALRITCFTNTVEEKWMVVLLLVKHQANIVSGSIPTSRYSFRRLRKCGRH